MQPRKGPESSVRSQGYPRTITSNSGSSGVLVHSNFFGSRGRKGQTINLFKNMAFVYRKELQQNKYKTPMS